MEMCPFWDGLKASLWQSPGDLPNPQRLAVRKDLEKKAEMEHQEMWKVLPWCLCDKQQKKDSGSRF